MHKRILVLSSFVLNFVATSVAQQDPAQTHFIYNKMMFNPGSTGLDAGFCGTLGYRNQWDRLDGAPNTTFLNVEGNMNRWFPGGLGINFCNDAIGFNRHNNLMLNYSYPLELPGGNVLGAGIGLGMMMFGMNPTWVAPQTLLDNSLPVGFSSTALNINFGLYFKSSMGFYAGLSATHLNAPTVSVKDAGTGLLQTPFQYARHFYLMGGYKKSIGANGDNAIDAQMMLRTDQVKTSIDLNARFFYKNMGYAGLTYRTSDAIAIMLGYTVLQNKESNFVVGYSYDINIGKLASVNKGSHELVLKYCRYLPIPPVAVSRHVRWL